MDAEQILVLAGTAAAIITTGLFFFGPRKRTAATAQTDGRQQIDLVVDGGYRPDRIVLRAGLPARINVLRTDRSPCSEQIVLGDFGVSRHLPTGKVVPIDLPPLRAGVYTFTCGMNMLRGQLEVQG
jgi:plastocyanin domain-containing protein